MSEIDLDAIENPGLVMAQARHNTEILTRLGIIPGEPCGHCHRCLEGVMHEGTNIPVLGTRMILCPDCGNKRCPKANDHLNACTDSNDTGQAGSAYP